METKRQQRTRERERGGGVVFREIESVRTTGKYPVKEIRKEREREKGEGGREKHRDCEIYTKRERERESHAATICHPSNSCQLKQA